MQQQERRKSSEYTNTKGFVEKYSNHLLFLLKTLSKSSKDLNFSLKSDLIYLSRFLQP